MVFAGREKHTLLSMLGVPGVLSALHIPRCYWNIRHTYMHWLWPKFGGADCAEPDCFVAVQTDKQAELLWCSHPPDQSRPAKSSWLLHLVFASWDRLGIWLCYIWQRPSSRTTLPSQASPKRLMSRQSAEWSHRCREPLMETPDTSWLDLSHPDSSSPDIL